MFSVLQVYAAPLIQHLLATAGMLSLYILPSSLAFVIFSDSPLRPRDYRSKPRLLNAPEQRPKTWPQAAFYFFLTISNKWPLIFSMIVLLDIY